MGFKRPGRLTLPSCSQGLALVKAKLLSNNLWQRILKDTISIAITLIIGVIPEVIAVYGHATYFGPIASAFSHPGQRFGQLAEALFLTVLGAFVGMGWGLLGLHLSSLAYDSNVQAAWAIRAVFFVGALLLHAILRASTPRLFNFVFWLMLINLTILTGSATSVSVSAVTGIAYPILTAVGVILLVNITVFPESSNSFLGTATIETLSETISSFGDATEWFITNSRKSADEGDGNTQAKRLRTKLIALTEKKPKLRAKLGSCKAAQAECSFELVFSVLPPRSLKPISVDLMPRLVQVTISLINACESKYALAGYGHNTESSPTKETAAVDEDLDSDTSSSSGEDTHDHNLRSEPTDSRRKSSYLRNLQAIKPIREIESGDIDLLEQIMWKVRAPALSLQSQIMEAAQVVSCALAYCYDMPKLPSGSKVPNGIILEEIDTHIDIFTGALSKFDMDSAVALQDAAAMFFGDESMGDLTPRMETHLISAFLISLRHAACQVLDMLTQSRSLVDKRQARLERRRLYWPRISWMKWLTSGGEKDANALPENARKEARTGRGMREDKRAGNDAYDSDVSNDTLVRRPTDEETGEVMTRKRTPEKGKTPHRKGPPKAEASNILWLRGLAADAVEFFADSDTLAFAIKMCIAAFIVTWPAFVPAWNAWYVSVRGSWASLQLILVFEVSIGTSFKGFFLRAAGTIGGCTIGYLAYKIGQGNRIVLIVILILGFIPSSYIQQATPFVKTGIISTVSLSVVGLATILFAGQAEPWDIYLKRMVCFLVGGTVALLVEMILFPVRARDRLVESIASSIQQISNMETAVAVGVDSSGNIDFKAHAISDGFHHAKSTAGQALDAARTFLPFCLLEPRLKGSFKGQALIYGEIIYVLFQIIDRMDSMLHIRKAYGSSVLEEFHAEVRPYRRNVAASITLTLFAVHEALTTRLPLPQFLPSSRVAQLRYVSHVRELLVKRAAESARASGATTPAAARSGFSPFHHRRSTTPHQGQGRGPSQATVQSFLAWNAASAGMMEIVEFLEELVDLAKLLVGVNAFRSGMLERPRFREYVARIRERQAESRSVADKDAAQAQSAQQAQARLKKSRSRASSGASASGGGRRLRGFSFTRRPQAAAAAAAASASTTTDQSAPGAGTGPVLRRRQTTALADSSTTAAPAVGATGGDAAADAKTTTTTTMMPRLQRARKVESNAIADGEEEEEQKGQEGQVDDLPVSLQRIMSKRMEDREAESSRGRARRHTTEDPKGKRALRKSGTWMG
ncbi:hypothetical protein GGR56DRAFT_630605 [Xylariaceae sp. FL0804]|nr:hypothetical protein GGR56DRAFT_630605 [Xylariaceae sp. FL0804]